jgi:hypothetical protein
MAGQDCADVDDRVFPLRRTGPTSAQNRTDGCAEVDPDMRRSRRGFLVVHRVLPAQTAVFGRPLYLYNLYQRYA